MDRKRLIIKLAGAAAIIAGLILGSKFLGLTSLLTRSLEWVSGLGVWGPAIFLVIYVIACVLLIPGSILTLGAGVVWTP